MPLSSGWKNSVEDGVKNKYWDDYDNLIQTEITWYNHNLAVTSGFVPLDWKLFKAVLWVESGGPANAAWKTRPFQIGNAGDPGYQALKDVEGASALIMPTDLAQQVKTGSISQPNLNVRAGIAYALIRLSKSDLLLADDPQDRTLYEYRVRVGDNLPTIAGRVGTTVDSLKKQNPAMGNLSAGLTLKYRKAKLQRVITGWRTANTSNLAIRYNSGDPNYREKLDYVLALFTRLKR